MTLIPAETERILAEGIRRGESPAMQRFYTLYSPYLSGICSRYLGNGEDARDLVQEAFIKIFTRIARFTYRGEGSFTAWCNKIAVNEALLFLRSHKREQFSCMVDEVEDSGADPYVDDIPQDAVMEMIRNLPTRYRTVFNLYVFEEKSHKEIGSMLGIKEDTSASNLHRAKKILSDMIAEYRKSRR